MTWIVMTAAAHMPSSCKGTYRKVALVKLTKEYADKFLMPKFIGTHARGVERVKVMGKYHVGSTPRCAYAKALAEAIECCKEMNTED